MPRYVKDEINFHKFLDAMLQLKEVTLEQRMPKKYMTF